MLLLFFQLFTRLGAPRRNLLLFLFITGENNPAVALVGCFTSRIKDTVQCSHVQLRPGFSLGTFHVPPAVISTVGRQAPCAGMHEVREHARESHSFVSTAQ